MLPSNDQIDVTTLQEPSKPTETVFSATGPMRILILILVSLSLSLSLLISLLHQMSQMDLYVFPSKDQIELTISQELYRSPGSIISSPGPMRLLILLPI